MRGRPRLWLRAVAASAATFSFVGASTAHANFIGNYASWKKVEQPLQEAYLIGVMDSWTRTSTQGEPAWFQVQRIGLNKCMREQRIDSGMLRDLVDTHYKTYPADWRLSPAAVLKDSMVEACLADVNSERAKAGLSAWERKPGQISADN